MERNPLWNSSSTTECQPQPPSPVPLWVDAVVVLEVGTPSPPTCTLAAACVPLLVLHPHGAFSTCRQRLLKAAVSEHQGTAAQGCDCRKRSVTLSYILKATFHLQNQPNEGSSREEER